MPAGSQLCVSLVLLASSASSIALHKCDDDDDDNESIKGAVTHAFAASLAAYLYSFIVVLLCMILRVLYVCVVFSCAAFVA